MALQLNLKKPAETLRLSLDKAGGWRRTSKPN